jgi:ankyrin repeat protein
MTCIYLNAHRNQTALMYATKDGHTEVVKLLLDAGANMMATNECVKNASIGSFIAKPSTVGARRL